MHQDLHISIWQLSTIFLLTSQALSCWIGQTHICRFLQIFDWVQAQVLAGPLKDITVLCISYSCCVLRVTLLLEGEPSAQSEVLNALDWFFMKAISIFWCIELFFSTPMSPSVPAAENSTIARCCNQYTLILGWYSAVPGFL